MQDDTRTGLQEKVCELLRNVKHNEKVLETAEKFKKLNCLYCIAHDQVGQMNCISENDVNEASQSIQQCISHFWKLFPKCYT